MNIHRDDLRAQALYRIDNLFAITGGANNNKLTARMQHRNQ